MANSTPLKEQNRVGLANTFLANVVLFLALSLNLQPPLSGKSEWVINWLTLTPAAVSVIVVGILNSQIDSLTKARLVFLRWKHPLPGSRAFTKYVFNDPRIDPDALTAKLGKLPSEPAVQDRVWYRLYTALGSAPQIISAHKGFLFARDYHVFAIAFLLILGPVSFWTIESHLVRTPYILGLIAQYAMTGQSARVHGERLVCSVLALSTAEPPKEKIK